MLAWLELREPPVRNVILPELVKAASLAPPFVLVLDDAHTVQNPQCWRVVEALGEGLSAGSSLVICSRSDPPLPASRLRSQDRLSDYGFDDLAFDRDEVARLLDLHGLECDEHTADDLLAATEGWAAAVYLAVLAWRSGDCPRQTLPSGDRRQIADYLTAEVLAGQPPDVVRFLTRTSIVPQLCPDLCAELTGRDDSAQLLEAIEHENLFLAPLDDRREWYRYHHLFRELLEVELKRREPHVLPELHRRAAAWFEAADHVTEAVDHLISAGDVQGAADLAARRWWPFYLTRARVDCPTVGGHVRGRSDRRPRATQGGSRLGLRVHRRCQQGARTAGGLRALRADPASPTSTPRRRTRRSPCCAPCWPAKEGSRCGETPASR